MAAIVMGGGSRVGGKANEWLQRRASEGAT